MNGKAVLSFALFALLIIAAFDASEACKKCGYSYCNCLPSPALGHRLKHGYGHRLGGYGQRLGGYGQRLGGYGLGYTPPQAPVCLPSPALAYPPPSAPAYLPSSNYGYSSNYIAPPVCNTCGGYSIGYGASYYPRRHHYRPRCRCY